MVEERIFDILPASALIRLRCVNAVRIRGAIVTVRRALVDS